jgi:peptidyl-prolyl cis-trans isomerase A (cyclophilin A)
VRPSIARFVHALLWLAILATLPSLAHAQGPQPGFIRVRLETSAGPIVLALDAKRAPKTTANFMAYVDDGRLDDTKFYRSARRKSDPKRGFIQGGVGTDARRTLPPVPHEPTDKTGIKHLDATISMARGGPPGSAMGNFFITVGPVPYMDAQGGAPGYAAFGHVVSGMDVVKRILAMPTGGGEGAMKGQKLLKPIIVTRAVRLDGKAGPVSRFKPWMINVKRRDQKPVARK